MNLDAGFGFCSTSCVEAWKECETQPGIHPRFKNRVAKIVMGESLLQFLEYKIFERIRNRIIQLTLQK